MYSLDPFGADILHDIASPFTTIMHCLELLAADKRIKQRFGPQIDLAEISAKRVADLLRSEDRMVTVELTQLLEQTISSFRTQPDQSGVLFALDIPSGLQLSTNPQMLRRILQNLITNSIDALANCSHPQISVSAREMNGQLQLQLQDNGCGVSPDTLTRIFAKGFSTKHEAHAGLGLFIVKILVEQQLGGSVCVESQVGLGTKFTICLPR